MRHKYSIIIISILVLVLSQIAISQLPTIKVNETDMVNIRLLAVDLDNDNLTYEYSSPLNNSGKWQTTYGDYGEYIVNVSASDGKLKTTQKFKLIVEKVNWPPKIKPIKDMKVYEGSIIELDLNIEDKENDLLEIQISEPFNKDGIWNISYNDAGKYSITVKASDNTHTTIKEFEIEVINVNRAPYLTATSPDPEDDITMKEGEELSFLTEANDPDNDNLSYTWEVDCEVQDVNIKTECKTITREIENNDSCTPDKSEEIEVCEESGTGPTEFRYKPGFEDSGEHTIKVTIADKEDSISTSWNVNVENVNRAPTLKNFEDIIVDEGELVTIDIKANDPDGDKIFYSIPMPVGDDKEWQTTYEDAGEYTLDIKISDGNLNATKPLKIIVNDVDRAPDMKKIDDINIKETDTVKVTLSAQDPDGDEITYDVKGLPKEASFDGKQIIFKSNYDTIKKPKTWYVEVLKFLRVDNFLYSKKAYDIEITAKGKEKSTTQNLRLTVNDKNRAPMLLPMKDIVINETEKVVIKPKVIEYDNDRIEFSISEPLKSGEWKTDYQSSGEYTVKVTAFDGKAKDTKNVTIKVNSLNRPPKVLRLEPRKIKENETLYLKPDIVDPDQDDVELFVNEGPNSSYIYNNTFIWTPDFDSTIEGKDKDYPVSFTAKDEYGWEGFGNTIITVINQNREPIIYNVTPQKNFQVETGKLVYFIPGVIDQDNETLEYEWKSGFKTISQAPAISRIFTRTGKKEITFRVTDDKIIKKFTWNINVVEAKETKTTKQTTTSTKEKTVRTVPKPTRLSSIPSTTIKYEIENKPQDDKEAANNINSVNGNVNTEIVEKYNAKTKSPVPEHMTRFEIN